MANENSFQYAYPSERKSYACAPLQCRCGLLYHWPGRGQQYDFEKDKSGVNEISGKFLPLIFHFNISET